jgi:hypothetical protein
VKYCHSCTALANLPNVNATTCRALLGALVIALSLGGCAQPDTQLAGGSQDNDRAIPSPSVIPQPVKPAEADERSERGARQFTLYWFKTANYAIQTGDIKPLEKASHPDCEMCQAVIAGVQKDYGDGGYAEGGLFTIRSTEAQNFALAEQPTILVTFDRSAQSSLAPDGQVRGSKPAASFKQCQVMLVQVARVWRVRTVFGDSLSD